MVDPLIGSAVIGLIQIATELAKQHGMTLEQMNQHFLESWAKVQNRPASELPDAGTEGG